MPRHIPAWESSHKPSPSPAGLPFPFVVLWCARRLAVVAGILDPFERVDGEVRYCDVLESGLVGKGVMSGTTRVNSVEFVPKVPQVTSPMAVDVATTRLADAGFALYCCIVSPGALTGMSTTGLSLRK